MIERLPKGIKASGGFRQWADRPDIVEKHNGIDYDGIIYRFEHNYTNKRIADDCGLSSTKPVKNWKKWILQEKEEQNATAA